MLRKDATSEIGGRKIMIEFLASLAIGLIILWVGYMLFYILSALLQFIRLQDFLKYIGFIILCLVTAYFIGKTVVHFV